MYRVELTDNARKYWKTISVKVNKESNRQPEDMFRRVKSI